MDFQDYFQSYKDYFWQWEDNMDVIAIPNGSTIAYRELVMDIIEKLSAQGLPPFGALLLAIIATNPDAESSLNAVSSTISKFTSDYSSKNKVSLFTDTIGLLNGTTGFLKLLFSQIPEKYKKGKNRILLLQTLFQDCHNIVSKDKSGKILNLYRKQGERKLHGQVENQKEFDPSVFYRDFRTVQLLLSKFDFGDIDTIIKKISDLPEIEEDTIQIEEKTIPQSTKKDWVQELIENEDSFYVGSLIRQIWAGLTIPLHNAFPSQQPIGGVADLTNKGDFDRLLLSEFANEDLIFLSRLANNEALYINREIPPVSDNLQRIILIDASLKNWGTPKIIAFALLLAIAKHPKTDIHCAAFVIGQCYTPILFENIGEIIDSLQILDTNLHAGEGLALFFKEYTTQTQQEIFLISSKDSLHAPAMQKAVNEHYASINYWIQTDAEGNIDIYKKQHNSKKHLQHLLLPLKKLWKREKNLPQKQDTEQTDIQHYPILFPTSSNPKKTLITNEDEIFQITKEGNLMRLYEKSIKKGWELMYQHLPFVVGEFQIGCKRNSDYELLMFQHQNKELTILNITQGTKSCVTLNEWLHQTTNPFLFHSDTFFYHKNRDYNLFRLSNSENGEIKVELVEDKQTGQNKSIIEKGKLKEETLKEQINKLPIPHNILKNVNYVFINENFELVFNTHKLMINQNGIIKLEQAKHLARRLEAIPNESKSEFIFPDGSSVFINRSGMLVLKEQENMIFIPSVLDASLGVGSEKYFAGNEYYYRDNQRLKIIKSTEFWEKYIKSFIDNLVKLNLEKVKIF